MRDPYDILGVARSSSAAEIKQAYRRLAKKLHPDLNPGNRKIEQQFKEVTAAYRLLSDAEDRRRFDAGEIDAEGADQPFREDAYRSYRPGGRAGRSGGAAGFGFDDAVIDDEDWFRDLFGSPRHRTQQRLRGADASYVYPIEFEAAALGTKRRLRLNDGKTIDFVVPVGCKDGQVLRLKGQGLPGYGGAPHGDAFIEIKIEPHPLYRRESFDIHMDLPITLQEAVFGAAVEVPTLQGRVALTIPKGSNTGTVLRIRAKGIEDARRHLRGDHYVRLTVKLPDKVTPELAEWLDKWAKANPYKVREN